MNITGELDLRSRQVAPDHGTARGCSDRCEELELGGGRGAALRPESGVWVNNVASYKYKPRRLPPVTRPGASSNRRPAPFSFWTFLPR